MAKNNINPLFDNILIRPIDADVKTTSGIILPGSAQKESQIGEVVALGPGKINPKGEKEQIVVKVGQKVIYKKYSVEEIKINGEELVLIPQKEILAIID